MFTIDRLNNLLAYYGMSEERGPAFAVDFHDRLNSLDRTAQLATRMGPAGRYNVGARLARHEALLGWAYVFTERRQ